MGINEPCVSYAECDGSKYLTCTNGYCQCYSSRYWDSSTNQCRINF